MQSSDDAPIKIERYEDMTIRPRFVKDLDPKLHRPKRILGEYHLLARVPCGLPDHTPHLHGVLIETEDDYETNMGWECAAGYFPDQFDAMRKAFIVTRAKAAHMDVI